MHLLVSGIKKWALKAYVKPVFKKRRYDSVVYHLVPEVSKAQQLIDSRKSIDLLVLGGVSAKDFGSESSECENYWEYLAFAQKNPRIPSIILIYGVDLAVRNSLDHKHPPNFACYFSEFESMTREQIDLVLKGRNLAWRD